MFLPSLGKGFETSCLIFELTLEFECFLELEFNLILG